MKKTIRYCSHCGFAIKKECQCCPNCGIILLESETTSNEETQNNLSVRSKKLQLPNHNLEVGLKLTLVGLNIIGLIFSCIGLVETLKRPYWRNVLGAVCIVLFALIKLGVVVGLIVYFVLLYLGIC